MANFSALGMRPHPHAVCLCSRAQGEQWAVYLKKVAFSFLRLCRKSFTSSLSIKTIFGVLLRKSHLKAVQNNKVLCSAFSVEQRSLKSRQFKGLDFTKLTTLIVTCITSTNTDESSLEVKASRWMMKWCGCEHTFFERYHEIQYFSPLSIERRRCKTLRHDPNQTESPWKKYPQGWKYRALLLSNATSSNKESPLLCDMPMLICLTLTTALLT